MIRLYIIEIKNRISLIIISLLILLVTSYFYKETLLFILVKPCIISDKGFTYFITTDLTEIFLMHIDITCFVSSQILFSFIIYHMLSLLSPALYKLEYVYLKNYVKVWLLFWIICVILFNYKLLPKTWLFFIGFQKKLSCNHVVNMYFEARLLDYVSYYKTLYFICFISSQVFFLTYVLFDLVLNKRLYMKKFRKVFYTVYFLIATLLTPPDVISQVMLGLSFIVFFESLLFVILLKHNLIRQPVKAY